jgi:hypothetical protein
MGCRISYGPLINCRSICLARKNSPNAGDKTLSASGHKTLLNKEARAQPPHLEYSFYARVRFPRARGAEHQVRAVVCHPLTRPDQNLLDGAQLLLIQLLVEWLELGGFGWGVYSDPV